MTKLDVQTFSLPGIAKITPRRLGDARGWFRESWNQSNWKDSGLASVNWVQDNEAFTKGAGTFRGLHFQRPPHAQAKLIRVISGAIFDVVVDVRVGSPTFGKALGVELDAVSGAQLLVPRGFAHGYLTLVEETLVQYKCDQFYHANAEAGVAYDDPALQIKWPRNIVQVNQRDANWPNLKDLNSPFVFDVEQQKC